MSVYVDDCEFILMHDETFEGFREITVAWMCGEDFGSIRMNCKVGESLRVDDIHRRDVNNTKLIRVCDILQENYLKLVEEA